MERRTPILHEDGCCNRGGEADAKHAGICKAVQKDRRGEEALGSAGQEDALVHAIAVLANRLYARSRFAGILKYPIWLCVKPAS